MTFWFWVLMAVAYLLAVAFIFSALFAWWGESAKRKADLKRLREQEAARVLRRYHHCAGHGCGLIDDTAAVHIDVECIRWTMRVNAALAELRREKLRRVLRELQQRKTARELPRAENDDHVH